MRINTQFVAVALSVKENVAASNGNKYYQISLDQDGECGSMSCSEDVYRNGIEKYKPYVFNAVFNDQYNRMSIQSVSPYKG